jgi:hypothetical protein
MDPTFQDRLSEGILRGIEKYIQATAPTASRRMAVPGRQDG